MMHGQQLSHGWEMSSQCIVCYCEMICVIAYAGG